MSDLCWTCQQNSKLILRAHNSDMRGDLTAKSEALAVAQDHLTHVMTERSFYQTKCDECKRSVRAHYTTANEFRPPPLNTNTPLNSVPIKGHLSFDYAQQVRNKMLKVPRKDIHVHYQFSDDRCTTLATHSNPAQYTSSPLGSVQCLGSTSCEALSRQVNFLCDEAGDCGKGSNSVISASCTTSWTMHHGLGK